MQARQSSERRITDRLPSVSAMSLSWQTHLLRARSREVIKSRGDWQGRKSGCATQGLISYMPTLQVLLTAKGYLGSRFLPPSLQTLHWPGARVILLKRTFRCAKTLVRLSCAHRLQLLHFHMQIRLHVRAPLYLPSMFNLFHGTTASSYHTTAPQQQHHNN